jgi:hypothetical protein
MGVGREPAVSRREEQVGELRLVEPHEALAHGRGEPLAVDHLPRDHLRREDGDGGAGEEQAARD